MKIVLINRYFFPDISATSQLLSDLAFFLAGEGHEVHVVTSRQRYSDPTANIRFPTRFQSVFIHRIWTTHFGRKRLLGRLIDYLSFHVSSALTAYRLMSRGDIAVCQTDPPLISVIAAMIVKYRRARLINWIQDLFPETAIRAGLITERGILTRALFQLRNWSFRVAAMNISISESMKYFVSENSGAQHHLLIRNWADGEDIRPIGRQSNPLREEWELEGRFIVGYSGNMGYAHEFDTILDAADKLKHHRDIVFLFIGDGVRLNWLKDQSERRLLANVLFKPYQPMGRRGLSIGTPDVHIVTLRPEMQDLIFPSKLYGVLAAGRPVIFIGDPHGEIGRLVRGGRCGFSIEAGAAEALAAVIEGLADDAQKCAEFGSNARQLFETNYNKQDALKSWLSVVEDVVRANGE